MRLGHAQHYKDNMFTFTVEDQVWLRMRCLAVMCTALTYTIHYVGVGHETNELSWSLSHVRAQIAVKIRPLFSHTFLLSLMLPMMYADHTVSFPSESVLTYFPL